MKQRQSNMELLRIVSTFMIVLFHCVYKSGFQFAPDMTANKLIVKCLWMLGELGVNLFMLLSGFFMVNSTFKWKKLILLVAEVQFYYWLSIFVAVWLGIGEFPTGKELFLAFFPVTMNRWWFITAYIMIYILTPYLNILANAMTGETYRKMLFALLTLFSIIPTAFGILFNTTESMLYYNRFIWLIVVYLIGAYMSKVQRISKKGALWLTAASSAVMVASILIINQFGAFFEILGTTEPAYFWPPNTIPMIALSVGVFGLFLHMRIPYRRTINAIASTTLGVYLLSDSFLAPWLWTDFTRTVEFQESPDLILRILFVTAVVLILGMVIDLIRQQLQRPLVCILYRRSTSAK